MVAVVVERDVGARRDALGQILEAFEEIGLAVDVRGGRDQLLGFGDRFR
jgi:hypothetical protein